MKDTIAQFMDDYHNGRISLVDLQRRLAFDQWKQDSKYTRLIEYVPNMRCPEDIVLAKYDYLELYSCLMKLRNRVPSKTWKILCMVAYGYTQEHIGQRLNIGQPAISKRISRVVPIAEKLNLKELLRAVIAWKQ
ncbi:MAG: hypothetical protein ACI3U2_06950 [Anaerovibrio sp.]